MTSNNSQANITITNTCSDFVSFCIRTNSPDNYIVRPNIGIINPQNAVEVQVILRNPNTSNASLFQILSAPIDREVAARILGQSGTVELKAFWKNNPPNAHKQIKKIEIHSGNDTGAAPVRPEVTGLISQNEELSGRAQKLNSENKKLREEIEKAQSLLQKIKGENEKLKAEHKAKQRSANPMVPLPIMVAISIFFFILCYAMFVK